MKQEQTQAQGVRMKKAIFLCLASASNYIPTVLFLLHLRQITFPLSYFSCVCVKFHSHCLISLAPASPLALLKCSVNTPSALSIPNMFAI